MAKKKLSERDIITKYIIPALAKSGWDTQRQVREEVSFTDGRIIVKGKSAKRGEHKRADIILYYHNNIPVAVIEAKDNTHTPGSGIQQALDYADILDRPVAISSNGDSFIVQYRKNCGRLEQNGNPVVTEELGLNVFPSPDELWAC